MSGTGQQGARKHIQGKGDFLDVSVVVPYQQVTVAFNFDEFDDVAVSFDFLFPIEA